ncbi:MAG: molecular chaperone [Thermomicrobiales bacterium]
MFNRIRAAALLTLFCTAGPACAGSIVLWPINPTIAVEEQATALWLENRGTEPATLQIRALRWHQIDGADRYDMQDEVVSSPPIATIPAGKRQLVRIVRRDGTPMATERSYRLLIDELPTMSPIHKAREANAQLAIQMRYSIPLFTYQGPSSAPRLDLRFIASEGKRFVEIRNSGNSHARLVDLRLVHGASTFDVMTGLVGYVLPGSAMRWPLPSDTPLVGSILVKVNGADQLLSPNA